MKSLNTKLVLSVLGIALLASPAFAAKHHQQASYQGLQNSASDTAPTSVGTYPNGAIRSGSVYSRESGADDNLLR
jgi:hypothetical protein